MCIKKLLYLLTGVAICFAISACKQKQQRIPVTADTGNKSTVNDSVVLPLTVIVTDDAIEGRLLNANDYPKSITVDWFDTAAAPIAAYGASQGLWLAPKGYTGTAATGADGTIAIRLFPPGGNDTKPPFVRYYSVPACMGCMMTAAAPFFENAKADLLKNYDSTMLDMVSIPKGLVIHKMSATLATYTDNERNGIQVTGVAYYSPYTDTTSTNNGFEQAEFALGPNSKEMTDLLVERYITMWGLK